MRIIIVGAGKVGYLLAKMLSMEDHDVTVVDQQESRLTIVDERLDVKTVTGSCMSSEVMMEAGIEETDILAAVTERDELNIVACFMAKSYGVDVTIARIHNPDFTELDSDLAKQALGINLIINPVRIAARQIAKMVYYPNALNVEYYDNGRVQLLEFKASAHVAIVGKKLRELPPQRTFLIVGIMRNGKMIIPGGNDEILANDLVFLLTTTAGLIEAEKSFGHIRRQKAKNIVIAGGDTISFFLAEMLEKRDFHIKIIEKDYDKCKELANKLNNSLIIRGDVTDIQLLKDENVGDADLFVAAAEDDRVNFMSALLAKELGANRTIVQLRMSDYIPVAESIGIDQYISPRLLAAGAILKYVRNRMVLSVTLIDNDKAQVMEMLVPAGADHVNIPLAKLGFPRDAIIGSIIRGDNVTIPSGQDVVLAGDRLIIFTLPEAGRSVEKFFREKFNWNDKV